MGARHSIGAGTTKAPHVQAGVIASSGIDPRQFVNGQDHRPQLGGAAFAFSVPVGCTSVSDRVLGPVPKEQFVGSEVGVKRFDVDDVVKGPRLEHG